MAAKPLRYTEKVVVSLTKEQVDILRVIAEKTGDTVSGILRRLAIQYISEKKQ